MKYLVLSILFSSFSYAQEVKNSICLVASNLNDTNKTQNHAFKKHQKSLINQLKQLGFDVKEIDLIRYNFKLTIDRSYLGLENYQEKYSQLIQSNCSQVWFKSVPQEGLHGILYRHVLLSQYSKPTKEIDKYFQDIFWYRNIDHLLTTGHIAKETVQVLSELPTSISVAIFSDALFPKKNGSYAVHDHEVIRMETDNKGYYQTVMGNTLSKVFLKNQVFDVSLSFSNPSMSQEHEKLTKVRATNSYNDIDFSVFKLGIAPGITVLKLHNTLTELADFTPIIQLRSCLDCPAYNQVNTGFLNHTTMNNAESRRIYFDGGESRYHKSLENTLEGVYLQKVACALEETDQRPQHCESLDEEAESIMFNKTLQQNLRFKQLKKPVV